MVTCAVSLKPLASVAMTSRLKVGVLSKSKSSLSLTVIAPVEGLMAKAKLLSLSGSRFPLAMAKV